MKRMCWLICVSLLFVSVKALATDITMTPINTRLSIKPNKKAKQVIEIKNRGYEDIKLKIYTTGYSQTKDGSPSYSSGPYTAEKWITITPEQLVIRPYDIGAIRFEVTTPEIPPGSYMASVMIEPIVTETDEQKQEQKSSAQFTMVGRLGHIVFIDVGKPIYNVKIESFGTTKESGKDKFAFRIRNTGKFNYPAKGVIKIESGGKKIKEILTGHGLVLRDSSRTIAIDMPSKLAPGSYNAILTLDGNEKEKLEARTAFTIK